MIKTWHLQQGQGLRTRLKLAAQAPTDPGFTQWDLKPSTELPGLHPLTPFACDLSQGQPHVHI